MLLFIRKVKVLLSLSLPFIKKTFKYIIKN